MALEKEYPALDRGKKRPQGQYVSTPRTSAQLTVDQKIEERGKSKEPDSRAELTGPYSYGAG